jgi:hypothetical protein
MRVLFWAVFVGVMAFTPMYLLDSMVMPELISMKESYSNFAKTAEEIAAGKPIAD